MKFSVCCTTRNRPFLALLFVLLFLQAWSAHAQTPSPSLAGQTIDLSPESIVEANTIQRIGKRPFHLRVSFQIYDLQGKAADSGVMEYWWAGPDGTRLDITSTALGTVHNTSPGDTQSQAVVRSLFLVKDLLDEIRDPGGVLGLPESAVVTEARTVMKVPLQCMHAVPPPSKYTPAQVEVCADMATGTIRLISGKEHQVTRNRAALFGNTRVALDTEVAWGDRKAITGHIEELKSFDPSNSAVALEKPSAPIGTRPAGSSQVRIAGGVLAGNKIGGPPPTYPSIARERSITGTVLLAAEITKEGKIARLVPLASPDPSLTEAATEAVQKWTYHPYLLNGEPLAVSTTITINFNINRGG